MQSKFNFYDFIGYIIPGAILAALLYWFCVGFLILGLTLEIKSIGESILFLATSYILGHIVQAVGNTIEHRQVKTWGGWFSEKFLMENDTYYSSDFKNSLKNLAQEVFGLSTNWEQLNQNEQQRKYQEIFLLCYALIVQENVALHTEIFNGIYGLYRGLISVFWMGIIVSFLVFGKHLTLFICTLQHISLPTTKFFSYDGLQLGLGIVLFFFFAFSIPPLKKRFKRFAQHFASSVYRNFYVWYKRKRFLSEKKPYTPFRVKRE